MQYDVFISYARADGKLAEELADACSRAGYSVWWDREIQAGSHFDRVVQDAMDASSIVIVIWTPDAVASNWVRAEATYALDAGKLLSTRIHAGVRLPVRFVNVHTILLSELSTVALGERLGPARSGRKDDPSRGDGPAAVPDAQLELVLKAVKLGHPCLVDVNNLDPAIVTVQLDAAMRKEGWRPSVVRYSDVRLGEVRTFTTENGPPAVVILLLDQSFSGHGCSFVKALATRPPGHLTLPSGLQVDPRWSRLQGVVIVTKRDTILALSDRDRAVMLEHYQSTSLLGDEHPHTLTTRNNLA